MASAALIEGLNAQLNREVSTFLRYILQAASVRGAENEPVREMYLSEVGDEVGHAKYLAQQIVDLGGEPKLEPDLTPPPSDVREMLKHDAAQEREDVQHYGKLADLAESEGLIALKLRMEEQAADEGEHGRQMERFLG